MVTEISVDLIFLSLGTSKYHITHGNPALPRTYRRDWEPDCAVRLPWRRVKIDHERQL